ncbi:unnamed protein product [Closterium sp. NIES-53]
MRLALRSGMRRTSRSTTGLPSAPLNAARTAPATFRACPEAEHTSLISAARTSSSSSLRGVIVQAATVQHAIVQGMQLCSNLFRGISLLPLFSNMEELASGALLLLLCTAVALRVVVGRIGDPVRAVFLVPPHAAILVTILGGPSIEFLIAQKPGVPLLLTIPATPFHFATSTRLALTSRFRTATPTGTSLLVVGVVVLLCTASSTTEATEYEEEKGAEGEMEQICCFGVNLPHEPASMEEALAGDDREAWLASREDEFRSHMENETWTLTNLAPGRKALDCTWVLRVKTDAEGRLERRKTRLVIKGFQQTEGIDFQEVFAPVAKAPTLRLLLAAAAVCGWKVEQMDVKTAFLYGVVEEEIYMKQPEEYDDGIGRVCRLNKAIYGLKQAPRCWYARLVVL